MLFVDTLLNVHLYDLDDKGALRPPSELDGTTVGVRSDAGYRFGGFNGGAFIEPLATIEAIWSDIDGFTSGPTSISFDDDANVRGRLGLRAGTSRAAWEGATVETFVIGSLWGNLSGDNQATVTSNGTTFKFEDNPDDVWAEVSLGVNLADPGRKASMFGKVDVTFGDDVTGVGGKAGIRIGW
jgi:autotransporter family porin